MNMVYFSEADFKTIRDDFPIFKETVHNKPLVYLDSAATTQKPSVVIDAMGQFYSKEYGTVHRAIYYLAAQATFHYDQVREQIRAFLNAAHADEIIFTRGTTDGINLVAGSFGRAYIEPDDEILICETEHHSNIVPWQILCKEKKAHLRVIPVNDSGELIIEEYEKLLSERTKLVSIAHIANSTGVEHPVKEIISLAHAKGARVLIDAAQSAAHQMIDVKKLDADFVVFSGHKAYGPTGIGILYGKRELLANMPPYQGGGDMIEQVSFESTTFQPPPLRFEAGTPSIAEVIGLGAAIGYIQKIGREPIALWEQKITSYAAQKLKEMPGIRFIGSGKANSTIITFVFQDVHPLDIGTWLDFQGVAARTGHLCAQPAMKRFGISSAVRVSCGIYNTIEDIDRFIEALQTALQNLRS